VMMLVTAGDLPIKEKPDLWIEGCARSLCIMQAAQAGARHLH